MTVRWSDAVDEILGGDQVVMLASVTPADGVVLGPVTNFAIRDRDAGTVTVNSSIGAWKKLERMRRNPQVALAFHTRRHSLTGSPEYVLIQGAASLSPPVQDYPETIGENWERFDGPRGGPFWRQWLRVYETRVSIQIAAHRTVVWPNLAATGSPQVFGAPLPDQEAPSQRPPGRGIAPRLDSRRATEAVTRLPHVLLGWVDTDGFPVVVPVETIDSDGDDGLRLQTSDPMLPAGERRSGLTAHAFTRHVLGQRQRVFTGWLRTDHHDGSRGSYAPHTQFGYRMPPSKFIYRLVVGFATRRGLRASRRTSGTTLGWTGICSNTRPCTSRL